MANNWQENVYYSSPLWLQHVLASAQGGLYKYFRSRPSIIRKHYKFLIESQYWSSEQYNDYQVKELQRLLKLSFENVPYYRDIQNSLGCVPEDFKSPCDINKLPILEKSVVRENYDLLINKNIELKRCSSFRTSGTTGMAIQTWETQDSVSYRSAFMSRLRTWTGMPDPFFPRRAHFTGTDIIPFNTKSQNNVYWRWNVLNHTLLFSASHISRESAKYYCQKLCSFNPETIEGHPSAFQTLVKMALDQDLQLPHPRAIITSGEVLTAENREILAKAFMCKIFDQYAANEPSCFWSDCEMGTLHVHPEYGISEIIDVQGNEVGANQEGEIILTSFLNPVFVLIRYRICDIAVKGVDRICSCGRQMPIIERIQGRTSNSMYIPERGYVSETSFSMVFAKFPYKIIDAQIIQEESNRLLVLIVPSQEFSDLDECGIISAMRDKVGRGAGIQVRRVDTIPRGPRGKKRFLVTTTESKH